MGASALGWLRFWGGVAGTEAGAACARHAAACTVLLHEGVCDSICVSKKNKFWRTGRAPGQLLSCHGEFTV
jgi:hypothetical protein